MFGRQGCGENRGWGQARAFLAMGPGGFGWNPGGRFHFHFDDGDEGGSRRGRGRRRFGRTELGRIILKLIADQPRHGYELIKAIEELTHGDYSPSPGMVYPVLSFQEDLGRIAIEPGEGARKRYAITDEGRDYLERHAEEVARLFEGLEESGDTRRRSSRPEIGRAMRNLMEALKVRVARDGWNEELLEEVVDILDEAARRIERGK